MLLLNESYNKRIRIKGDKSMNPKIVSISHNDNYTLLVTSSDKKTKLYDMNLLLEKSSFD